MAQIIPHPRAKAERVIQTRVNGRLPNAVPMLRNVRRKMYLAKCEADQITEKIAAYQNAIGMAQSIVRDYQLAICNLSVQRREVCK